MNGIKTSWGQYDLQILIIIIVSATHNNKNILFSPKYLLLTVMHLADAFIQSDLQCIQVIHLLSVCVFPENWTHNLLRC